METANLIPAVKKRGGWKLSAETRARMSKAFTGRVMSAEARAKMSVRAKARGPRPQTEAERAKRSATLAGRKFSEEHKRSLSKAMKGKCSGEKSTLWKGGRPNYKGYVQVHSPGHPHRNKHNYVAEHRLVMEKHLGRFLTKTEVVHHINEDKADNRIENLMLFPSNVEHKKHHQALKYDTNPKR